MPKLFCGDCLQVLKTLEAESVDSVVSDPPYGLSFMGKGWDYKVPTVEIWRECLRVLKPGGHLLAFAGTRTQHRMCVNIEDAGFEIRDMIAWVYGSGFPKSRNVGDGWGTALKPALEPITVARKPFKRTVANNVLEHGTGAINIDGCRVATDENPSAARRKSAPPIREAGSWANDRRSAETFCAERPGEALGRWPANLIHDGSDEVTQLFPESKGQQGAVKGTEPSSKTANAFGEFNGRSAFTPRNDSGSAARFFYCAKASKKDREDGNTHPTVKPTDLMAYLCRLVTPKGGTVLDPFMGSGSTGKAAFQEGFHFVGIEREQHYFEIAKKRLTCSQMSLM